MLSSDEVSAIRQEMSHYPEPRAACVEALKIVQRRNGWVSDAQLVEVAQLLGMAVDELEGVATFYNLIFRQPVGRHVVLFCDSVCCWMMGQETLQQRLERQLRVRAGETTADGRFTLLPVPCLGRCDHAPVWMVGEDTHGVDESEPIETILQRYS